ncbi:hypothetical protein CCACVL1_29499 [Corchorus capsularis]|uniref:Uncharacterized protein n=1 Tax=Corchorus capsularis TaxID=210143 RepID=A0A1R3G1H0_COCAP|nr:hypothetical protein CCACVL1_29499 [Corchorus capsularis]
MTPSHPTRHKNNHNHIHPPIHQISHPPDPNAPKHDPNVLMTVFVRV